MSDIVMDVALSLFAVWECLIAQNAAFCLENVRMDGAWTLRMDICLVEGQISGGVISGINGIGNGMAAQ